MFTQCPEGEMGEVFTFSLSCSRVSLSGTRSHWVSSAQLTWKARDISCGHEERSNSYLSFSPCNSGMQWICINPHGLARSPSNSRSETCTVPLLYLHSFTTQIFIQHVCARDSLGHWEYNNKQNIKNPFILDLLSHWEAVG